MSTRSASSRTLWLCLAWLLVVSPAGAQEAAKIKAHVEKDLFARIADELASAFESVALPEKGRLQHPIVVDGSDTAGLGGAVAGIKAAYEAGLPVVVVEPTAETQGFLDEVTGGEVDLPEGVTARNPASGEPRLEAIGLQRRGGAAADTAEFWVAFDDGNGPAAEEKAEDTALVASIADWVREAPQAAAPARRPLTAAKEGGRPAIDDLTSAIVRKVSFQFDQGSMATVVKSWAAYSPAQNEDWYIFELTTTSQPLNFATYSAAFPWDEWEKNDTHCRAIVKSSCKRDRFATKVQVKVAPKTSGLELVYYGPDSDRVQDEYTYSSKFSLGGKVTAGYDDKGAKGGVELSAGAEFSRSSKVTIKDATLVGISNPATEVAGWRFEMPQMRTVNDLRAYGGPSTNCDNLLQMPYPVQRGAMESKQYAIYRLPGGGRQGLQGIDLSVSLLLEESQARLTNFSTDCNILNCNCDARNSVLDTRELKDQTISFPLAAHAAGQ